MTAEPDTRSPIAPAAGRLGVLLPGMGAVATTFIAGVEAVRRGRARPIGALSQLASLAVDAPRNGHAAPLREALPLAELDQLVFGGWDPIPDDAYTAARKAGVLTSDDLEPLREFLSAVQPMPAVFDRRYVPRLDGVHVKQAADKRALAEQLRDDIRAFRAHQHCARLVAIWCGSTEIFSEPSPVHETLDAFERGMAANDPGIAPSMLYAWACLMEGVPFCNGAPNLTLDVPALRELAARQGVPIAGKDFKTGQTWLKTVIAPGIRARMLGLDGWFSTNILGNRDGEVLDDPAAFRTKEHSKLSVLHGILRPESHPELYGDFQHAVRINYYRPRGDNKEGWDSIDLLGWMGYPMQVKVNFLCRDSILAAPLVLDLVLFSDLAARAGLAGIQEWLAFYFKSPMSAPGVEPVHDLFEQERQLYGTLQALAARTATAVVRVPT